MITFLPRRLPRRLATTTAQQLRHFGSKTKPKTKTKSTSHQSESIFESQPVQIVSGVLQFAAIMYCVQTYVIDTTMCIGPSMLPTFNSAGDIVLINRFSHRYRPVKLNDVIVAKSPSNPDQIVCKRVLGLEGDHVKYDRPRYGNMEFSYSKKGIVVPDGHIWLQGDNESNSTDSRHYGPVPAALVTGTVLMRIWPPKDVGPIEDRVEKTTRKTVVRTDAKKYQYDQRLKAETKRREKELNKKQAKAKEKEMEMEMEMEKKMEKEKEKERLSSCREKARATTTNTKTSWNNNV